MSNLISILKNKKKTIVPAVFGMVSFVLFIISFMISINAESSKWMTLLRAAITTTSVLCYCLCYYTSDVDSKYIKQISWVNIVVLVIHSLYCFAFLKTAFLIHYRSPIYMEILWLFICIVVLWNSRGILSGSVKSMRDKNTLFYVIVASFFAVVLIVLSYDNNGPRFVWDARSFYDRMSQLETTDAFDIGRFFIFSHVDVSYFYSVFMLAGVSGSLSTGYWMYNAICLTSVSFGIVFLLKKTLTNKSSTYVTIASAACLFSPYICGISTHYTYDYAICCLSPLLVLFAVDEDWIFFILLSAYISLLKETGIILVGSVCVGVVLSELVCDKASPKRIFLRKRTICAALIFLMFFTVYMIYSEWESAYQVGGFGFDSEHAMIILKMFGVFNFEWVVVAGVIGLIIGYVIKSKKLDRNVIIYITSSALLVLFYIFYVTNEYPRYTESFPVYMMLSLVTLLAGINIYAYLETCILTVVLALMVSSTFISFDPITKRLFSTAEIGNGTVYFSRQDFDFGGDPCVYNRQYYGLQIVYEKCLEKAINSNDELIAVSTGNNHNTWAVDGGFYAYDETIPKRDFTEFWNIKKGLRDPAYNFDFFSDPDFKTIDIRFIYPVDDIKSALKEGDSFIYIYIPTQNDNREDVVRDSYEVKEEGSFTSHGWVMSYIRGKANEGI